MFLTLNIIFKKKFKIKIFHHQIVEILLQNHFNVMTNS